MDGEEFLPSLLAEPILEVAIETCFSKLQPWIPFLHSPTFKGQMKDPHEKPKLTVLLHPIISVTIKHVTILDFIIQQIDLEGRI
jgi:hypothetical protein